MAVPTLSFLFFFVFTFFFFPISQSLPFIVIHGIVDYCSNGNGTVKRITENLTSFSGVQGYCLEVGNGYNDSWSMPLREQSEILCQQVKKMKELEEGYNIVGISQGNLIGRGVVQFCEGGPPVKNFISLGGPHAGTASVPLCSDISSILCVIADYLIKGVVYSDYVQEHIAPSGYLKLPNAIPEYLEKNRFLPVLNNEIPEKRNSTYTERFGSLEKLVLIMFEQDDVLIPKETSWFGYYPDGAFKPVLSPQETKLYIEDWIGLRTLDEAGRVEFISVPGKHVEISDDDMKKHVVPYLKDQASTEGSNSKGGLLEHAEF